jgi:hypothetical protein
MHEFEKLDQDIERPQVAENAGGGTQGRPPLAAGIERSAPGIRRRRIDQLVGYLDRLVAAAAISRTARKPPATQPGRRTWP